MSWKKCLALGFAFVLGIGVIGFFGVQSQKIEAEKEKVVAAIQEREATERTEERSQFWQKLIPWGNYEVETGDESEATRIDG